MEGHLEGQLIRQLERALWECACATDQLARQQELVDRLADNDAELRPALTLLASLKQAVRDKMQHRNEILLQMEIQAMATSKAAFAVYRKELDDQRRALSRNPCAAGNSLRGDAAAGPAGPTAGSHGLPTTATNPHPRR
jgi:hypothetical protein